MKITIKKLEFIFVIVYFLATLLCYLFLRNLPCVVGSLAGFSVSIVDWFLLKLMAKKWIKRGKYSMIDTAVRFIIVGISIYILLNIGVNTLGLILGISIIPFSLMMIAIFFVLSKRKMEV